MSRHVIIMFILLAFIISTNPAFTQPKVLTEASAQAGGFSTARLARLDSAMNDWVKKNWINGSVALIARHGKIVFDKATGTTIWIQKLHSIKTEYFALRHKQKPL